MPPPTAPVSAPPRAAAPAAPPSAPAPAAPAPVPAQARAASARNAPPSAPPDPVPTAQTPASVPSSAVYLRVHAGAEFQEVRRRYRRFAFPATAAFLLWYLGYVVLATSAPGLMGRPVAGALNVAMLAGLAQFLTTFLLTWAYARHARLRRDRSALELRWVTQEMTRERVR
ncbi:DUF485 domain-containing protein [Streptomyces palmae]|uniref:DUF485 domain-containing protein n=1 Tax=Streptomyces palmae TaxID=1701085 RepID=A0A4Z0HC05_9ACTN|nr:DUF485 domain-containing protein [Streptomyces palmae]